MTLVRVPGTPLVRGTVRGVRVVDARGSGDGWQLSVILPELGRRHASVSVGRVLATAASAAGIHARMRVSVDGHGHAGLLSADRGAGLGLFDVTLTIEARIPHAMRAVVTTPLHLELD